MSEITDCLETTTLPLDEMRQAIGISPYHFWQMNVDVPDQCEGVFPHYRWSGVGYPGRNEFIEAIVEAEQRAADLLGFWPGQRYEGAEVVRLQIPRNLAAVNRSNPFALHTKWMKIQQVGKRQLTLAGSAQLSYNSQGGNDVTASCPVPILGVTINPDMVIVCYPGTTNRIRPVSVKLITVSGVPEISITIKRWLCGDPDLWENGTEIDPTNLNQMLNSVDVYIVWYDMSRQITLAWEPDIYHCGCLEQNCVVCSNATLPACAGRGDYAHGIAWWKVGQPQSDGSWSQVHYPINRSPDIAYINYLHGEAGDTSSPSMNSLWRTTLSRLALTYLADMENCGCPSISRSIAYWQEDMSMAVTGKNYQAGPMVLSNLLNSRRGAVFAWRTIKRLSESAG